MSEDKDALIYLADMRIDQLEAENAELRELVRDVMPIVCDGCHERLCEMPKEEHPFVTCSFADRMRELGIEVEGCANNAFHGRAAQVSRRGWIV